MMLVLIKFLHWINTKKPSDKNSTILFYRSFMSDKLLWEQFYNIAGYNGLGKNVIYFYNLIIFKTDF